MTSHWNRYCLVVLAMLLASCSVKNKNESGATSDEPQASAATGDGAEIRQQTQLENIGAMVDLIVAEAADLPRAEFDPAALAKQLGDDPQVHFEWVRDHTWWAPYRGLLRGSKGVMLDRVGSSLDRAVLLGDLLRHAGHPVRLAYTELPPSRAQDLLSKIRPIPDQRRSPAAPKPMTADRKLAIEVAFPRLALSIVERVEESKRRSDEAHALVRTQAEQLYASVKNAAAGNGADDSKTIAALRDHWWVERQENGKWIPMDVLLPDAKSGTTVAAASRISEWKAKSDAPSIPESEWHAVQVRVVIERYDGTAATEATLLETNLRPATVFDRPITLMHMPRPWPEHLRDFKTDPNALGNAAVSVKEWVPFLRIGGEQIAQSGFTESGDLVADPLNPRRDIAKVGGGGFMTGFGEALGGGDTASSVLTAEWIDYEIHAPGESSQHLRRPVFDLLGPAKRAAKVAGFDATTNELLIRRYEALLSTTDILLQPCEFSSEFVANLTVRGFVAAQAAFRELSHERDPVRKRELASEILTGMETWGRLPYLALWRSILGNQRSDWFVDRTNVLNSRLIRPVVNADRVAERELTDVVANATGVRHGATKSPFEVRLNQGVADTIAEILTLGSDLRAAENTASLFASATAESQSGVLIRSRDSGGLQGLDWPEDPVAILADSIDSGFMAVALKEPVEHHGSPRVGWWRVDPVSGQTIGVMDTGFHANFLERWLGDPSNVTPRYLRLPMRPDPPIPAADLVIFSLMTVIAMEVVWYGHFGAGGP